MRSLKWLLLFDPDAENMGTVVQVRRRIRIIRIHSIISQFVYQCLSGSTGDSLEVWKELDLAKVEQDLRGVLSRGITSLAVLFLHSYTYVFLGVFFYIKILFIASIFSSSHDLCL